MQGWKYMITHRQMRITFRVNANHFDKVIRQIFLAPQITFGRLRINFQIDAPKNLSFSPLL